MLKENLRAAKTASFKVKVGYDERGYEIERTYYDERGRPTLNKDGNAKKAGQIQR